MSKEKQLSWGGNALAKKEADEAYSRLRKRRPRRTKEERELRRAARRLHKKRAVKIKSEYEAYINSKRWRTKRKQAIEHHGRACAICGATKRLHVHHVTYERFGDELMEDLQVLCRNCHEVHHDRKTAARNGSDRVTAEYLRLVSGF